MSMFKELNISREMINGITEDSRKVQRGFIFVAFAGQRADGRKYIKDAISNGASVIVTDESAMIDDAGTAQIIRHDNPRYALSQLTAEFYAAQPDNIVAVTGTNGKTSTVSFVEQIWKALGYMGASLGTLGLKAAGVQSTGVSMTTPDAPKGGAAVLNADSQAFEQLSKDITAAGRKVISFGNAESDMQILSLTPVASGQDVKVSIAGDVHDISVSFIGYYQLKNLLCAIGLVMASASGDLSDKALLAKILEIIPALTAPAGRLQFVAGHPQGAGVYIDYAHTPAALETVLQAVRPHTQGKLVCVFGCGGDRDMGKRPMMGKIASDNADVVIVTDDNPRSEAPASIRAAILGAAPDAQEIGDRRKAIQTAIQNLSAGDVLVIAGKGHEQGQVFADETLPFDDYSVAQDAIQEVITASS